MACSPGDNKAVSVVVNPVAGLVGFILLLGTIGVGILGSSGVTGSASPVKPSRPCKSLLVGKF